MFYFVPHSINELKNNLACDENRFRHEACKCFSGPDSTESHAGKIKLALRIGTENYKMNRAFRGKAVILNHKVNTKQGSSLLLSCKKYCSASMGIFSILKIRGPMPGRGRNRTLPN